MSQSSDALLFYGFPASDYNEHPPEEWYSLSEQWDREKAPFEVVKHCSTSAPMFFIAIRYSLRKARRGHPCRVPLSTLIDQQRDTWGHMLNNLVVEELLPEPIGGTRNIGWWLASFTEY